MKHHTTERAKILWQHACNDYRHKFFNSAGWLQKLNQMIAEEEVVPLIRALVKSQTRRQEESHQKYLDSLNASKIRSSTWVRPKVIEAKYPNQSLITLMKTTALHCQKICSAFMECKVEVQISVIEVKQSSTHLWFQETIFTKFETSRKQ
jgi:hypothetical protein